MTKEEEILFQNRISRHIDELRWLYMVEMLRKSHNLSTAFPLSKSLLESSPFTIPQATSQQQTKVMDIFKESGIYRTIGGRNHSYTDEGFKEFLAENTQPIKTILHHRKKHSIISPRTQYYFMPFSSCPTNCINCRWRWDIFPW